MSSCTNCGNPLKETAKFCGECGTGVGNADEPVKTEPEKKPKQQELEEYENEYLARQETKPAKPELVEYENFDTGLSRVGKDATRRYIKGSYHTTISDTRKLAEIEKIADRLEPEEEVLLVTRQTKNPLKSGHSMFTPNTVIVTDRKIILRDPSALGLRQNLESFRFDSIVDLKLERGVFSASISVNVAGLGFSRIDAISKDDAEQILRIYQEAVRRQRGMKQLADGEQAGSISDELAKLANLRQQEVISNEEFQEMKRALLNKLR